MNGFRGGRIAPAQDKIIIHVNAVNHAWAADAVGTSVEVVANYYAKCVADGQVCMLSTRKSRTELLMLVQKHKGLGNIF